MSGEMINFEKSFVIFSPNSSSGLIDQMRRPLGVECQDKLGIYLGCPMDIDGMSSRSLMGYSLQSLAKNSFLEVL